METCKRKKERLHSFVKADHQCIISKERDRQERLRRTGKTDCFPVQDYTAILKNYPAGVRTAKKSQKTTFFIRKRRLRHLAKIPHLCYYHYKKPVLSTKTITKEELQ